jgi:hypothetical protein
MRVLRTPLVDAYHERVAEIPKDTSGEPTCARLPFCGQTLEMHRFDAFVPAEGTTGDPQDAAAGRRGGGTGTRDRAGRGRGARDGAIGGAGAGALTGAGRLTGARTPEGPVGIGRLALSCLPAPTTAQRRAA